MSESRAPILVWDAPTRIFHWLLVILLGTSWLTEHKGWMELHFLSGYAIITALLFRLIWGFIGSETSRFTQFLKSPLSALHHVSRLHRREPDTEIGHNAAGGWMVLLMLGLLVVQTGTGLFANDDGDNEGPLFNYISKDTSDWLSHIHAVNFDLIKIVVVLHLVAIAAYVFLKGQDLIRPMITGVKYMPAGARAPRVGNSLLAIIVFLLIAGIVSLSLNLL